MSLTLGVPPCFRLSVAGLEVPFCLITSPLHSCLPPDRRATRLGGIPHGSQTIGSTEGAAAKCQLASAKGKYSLVLPDIKRCWREK